MSCDSEADGLREEIACLDEQTRMLNGELAGCGELLDKRNELLDQVKSLERWMDGIEGKEKAMEDEMLENVDVQTKKLRKAEKNECVLREENGKLRDSDECATEHLNAAKYDEQRLINEVEDLKACTCSLENELQCVGNGTDELKCTVDRLTQTAKCKEAEINELRSQMDDYKMACGRLDDKCTILEQQLDYVNTELEAAKSHAKLTEEKLKLEQEKLNSEMQIKCQKMHEMEVLYDETKQTLEAEKAQVKKLESLTADLREAGEKEQCRTKANVQKLEKDNAEKEQVLCRLQGQMEEMCQKNEYMASELESLRTQIRSTACLLEELKCSAERFEQLKASQCEELECERCSLAEDVKRKSDQIAELKQRACCLQQEIVERETSNCSQKNACCPPEPVKNACCPPEPAKNDCCPSSPQCVENVGYKCSSPLSQSVENVSYNCRLPSPMPPRNDCRPPSEPGPRPQPVSENSCQQNGCRADDLLQLYHKMEIVQRNAAKFLGDI